LATARLFAEEGAQVACFDISDGRKEVEEMRRQGGKAIFVRGDVGKETHVARLVKETVAAFGHLDVLVNNAGIVLAKKITETSESEWDRLMSVNLKGVFLCCKAAINVMRRHGGGVIVNVASELGLVGGADIAAYCASKGGIVQLTKAIAIDHACDNIRANCVCPGPVATPLLESIIRQASDPEAERRHIQESMPLKRVGRPEQIATVIAFLASEDASHITGAIVAVDGGWSAR
jgi:NAD(P)-dependent dehydrogenase (short-subunit alcohol dehydrogenase family)